MSTTDSEQNTCVKQHKKYVNIYTQRKRKKITYSACKYLEDGLDKSHNFFFFYTFNQFQELH